MRFLIIGLLSLCSVLSHAVNVTDLYKVSIAVDDQSETSRQQGISWAFQQLLVKVSGYESVLGNEALIAAVKNAGRYVQGYSYQHDDLDDQTYLEVWFSKALVLPLMKKSKAPVWGENRPLLTSWLAIEDKGRRLLISDQQPEWQSRFERVFDERGLPVLWPAADADDEAVLPIDQLWWLFPEAISKASERYRGDRILAGRLKPLSGKWQYEGFLSGDQARTEIMVTSDTPQAALNLALGKVATVLADQFAIKPGISDIRQGIRIDVTGIRSFADYAGLLSYLKKLTGVRHAEVAQVTREQVQLYLELEGDWAKVQRSIKLDSRLNRVQEMMFEWVPR